MGLDGGAHSAADLRGVPVDASVYLRPPERLI
jgi:hypothetical protein